MSDSFDITRAWYLHDECCVCDRTQCLTSHAIAEVERLTAEVLAIVDVSDEALREAIRVLRYAVIAKNLGLSVALAHLESLRMDTEEDETVRLQALDRVKWAREISYDPSDHVTDEQFADAIRGLPPEEAPSDGA